MFCVLLDVGNDDLSFALFVTTNDVVRSISIEHIEASQQIEEKRSGTEDVSFVTISRVSTALKDFWGNVTWGSTFCKERLIAWCLNR